jgi:hypothetical protein
VHRETNAPVKSETRYLDSTTGEPLGEHQMGKFAVFGGRKVALNNAEEAAIKTVVGEGRGLRLMGFKPRSAVKE